MIHNETHFLQYGDIRVGDNVIFDGEATRVLDIYERWGGEIGYEIENPPRHKELQRTDSGGKPPSWVTIARRNELKLILIDRVEES